MNVLFPSDREFDSPAEAAEPGSEEDFFLLRREG
jgi:hypothetical protein